MFAPLLKKTTVALVSVLFFLTAQANDKVSVSPATDNLADIIAGDIAIHRGMPRQAYRYYNEVLDRTGNTDIAASAMNAAIQTKDEELTLSAARRWIEVDPEKEFPHQTILMNAVQNNQHSEFLQELSTMYRLTKDKPGWVVRVTQSLARPASQKRFIESGLQPYWEKESEHAEVQIAIGVFYQTVEDTPNACFAASRATDLAPDNEKIIASAAELCWHHDKKLSERFLVSFLNKHPNAAPIGLIYSQVLARTGRIEQAVLEIKKAVRNAPEDPAILLNAGILASDCRSYVLSEDYLNQYVNAVFKVNPAADLSTNDVWTRLADVAQMSGNREKEIEYLKKLSRGPLAPDARLREANVLIELGRLDDAIALLEEAGQTFPEHTSLFLTTRAKLLIAHNRANDALVLMQAELAKNPNNESALYDTAMTATSLQRPDLAESYLLKLLEINPDHIQANNALGYIWVSSDKHLVKARRLIEHAYRLAPSDPYVLDSMGWLCFKEGRLDQATEFTMTSLKKLFDIEVAGHLVEILYQGGRVKDAEEFYGTLRLKTKADPRILEVGRRLGFEK